MTMVVDPVTAKFLADLSEDEKKPKDWRDHACTHAVSTALFT